MADKRPWEKCLLAAKPQEVLFSLSLRKFPGMSQLSKAIGHWWPWLSHLLLSLHFPLSRFQNRQGDLGFLTDATISCFWYAGFHCLSTWQCEKHLGKGKTKATSSSWQLANYATKAYWLSVQQLHLNGTMPFIGLLSEVKLESIIGASLYFPHFLLLYAENTKSSEFQRKKPRSFHSRPKPF